MIIDSAIYVDGRRAAQPTTLEETYKASRKLAGVAWIGLYQPTKEELRAVAAESDLHELAVDDAIQTHHRAKIERYDEMLFIVLKAGRYVDRAELIQLGEVHIFVGPDYVITLRHGEVPNLRGIRQKLESDPDLLRLGPMAILHGIIDRVVDDYTPVLAGLENDIDEIEIEVFSGNAGVSRRTYELSREVIDFQRATKPLPSIVWTMIQEAQRRGIDDELLAHLRDVQDHALNVQERVQSFREVLQNILNVNLAVVGLAQNEEVKRLSEVSIEQNDEVKKISAWAAILFAPTLIGTIYGMNFTEIPELNWAFGYPFALLLMALVSIVLYGVFKRRGWLS
jgi:magnesium transporter